MAQIYLPGDGWVGGWGGVGLTVIIMQVSVQMGLYWNYQLELSLAKTSPSNNQVLKSESVTREMSFHFC